MFKINSKSQHLCHWCIKPIYHDAHTLDLFYHHPYLCNACFDTFKKPIKLKLNGCQIEGLVIYDAMIQTLLYRYKEDKDIVMAPSFFYHSKRKLKKHKDWVFMMMPSSKEKTKERGFHPLYEMIKPYTKSISWGLYKQSDIKQSTQTKSTRQQIKLGINEIELMKLKGQKIILIDDVITTGHTLSSAYDLLKDHASQIKAIVFAVHPLLIESK